MFDNADTELHFIRVLSVGGVSFAGQMTEDDRRERIRHAILSQRMGNRPLSDDPNCRETFAQAYERLYTRKLDRRRFSRDNSPPPDEDDRD
jgi:hypothetical protein